MESMSDQHYNPGEFRAQCFSEVTESNVDRMSNFFFSAPNIM